MKRRVPLLVAILALAALAVALAWALLPRQSRVAQVAPTPTPTPTVVPTPTPTPVPAPTQRTVSVASYGAKGDGVSDDTAAVTAALKATAGKKVAVYFPAGTYRVGNLTLPARTILTGAGTSWLEGNLTVAGHSSLFDLKLGSDGHALHFVNGASHTTFTRVSFVGGGPMSGDGCVISFYGGGSASFISFTDCTIGADPYDGNGVSICDDGWSGATYHDLVWQGCHFLGSPRMTLECIQRSDGVHPITTGFSNINLLDCLFEPSGSETLSFGGGTTAGNSTISGNTFKGSGWGAYPWKQGIELESVGMTFVHNTVYRCAGDMINQWLPAGVTSPCKNLISDNTFDGTVSYIGTPATSPDIIYFNNVNGATFSDNVVKTNFGSLLIGLASSSNNSFVGNRLIDTRSQAKARPCVWAMTGSSHNLFTADTFNSSVLYGIAVFKSGSDQNTITDSSFAQPKSDSLSVASGLTVNLASNTYGP